MKKYTTISRNVLHQSVRSTLESHRVKIEHDDQSTTDHNWDVVAVPDAVAVLPITIDKQVLLLENYRYAVNDRFFELCAGLIEKGETPEDAAARELQEEMGFTGKLEKVFSFYTSPGLLTERVHLFFCPRISSLPKCRRSRRRPQSC